MLAYRMLGELSLQRTPVHVQASSGFGNVSVAFLQRDFQ